MIVIRAVQGLLVVAGFAAPLATFPQEGIWGGTGAILVIVGCMFGGLILAGLVGYFAERPR